LVAPRQEGLWTSYCLEPFGHGPARVCLGGECDSHCPHGSSACSFPEGASSAPLKDAPIEAAPPVISEDEGFSAPSPPAAPMAPDNIVPATPNKKGESGSPEDDPTVEAPQAPSPRAPSSRASEPVETTPALDQVPAPPAPPRNELPALDPADFDEDTDEDEVRSGARLKFLDQPAKRFRRI
jgi:hypothetical protein